MAFFWSKMTQLLRNHEENTWSRDEIREFKYSFSQFGEDIIVQKYLRKVNPAKGIYIDVGAFDPIAFSNTLLLYKQGWRGINIDLDDYKIDQFRRYRPGDYNIRAAVSDKQGIVKLLKYPARTTNRICSFDDSDLKSVIGEDPVEITTIQTSSLTEIIQESPFSGSKVYYLNVDCEGHDLPVLKSLDFESYAPTVISVEAINHQSTEAIEDFLVPRGYEHTGTSHLTQIFVLKEFLNDY